MKYYEPQKFPKAVGKAGFYSVIAICIVAIGAISWFAVSNYNRQKQKESDEPQISEPQMSEPSSTPQDTTTEPENPPQASIPSDNQSVEAQNSQESVPFEPTAEPIVYTLPINGKFIKDYSETTLQYSATYGDMRLHKGLDISAAIGSEVKSSASGTVIETEDDALLGKCITVEHTDGITIKYCGFDTLAVSQDEDVSTGRVLGTLGSVPSECADDSHLHIEVKKDGKNIAPSEIYKNLINMPS